MDRPYLHARIEEDGRASWDIMKAVREATIEEPEPGTARPLRVSLQRLEVEDGRIAFDDARSDVQARLHGIDHTLAGDFSAEQFTLDTHTTADSVSLRFAGVRYLTDARLEADAELDADMDARRFTFRENRLMLNRLGLGFDGTVTVLEDGANLDVTFAADRADFREILSLIPAIYTRDFEGLETDGFVSVNGSVRGRAGADSVPSFSVNAHVDDGRFRYPDLPLPVQRVFMDLSVTNPTADLDGTTVEVSRFDLAIGDEPFSATFRLSTPVSDPELEATANGTLDLSAVHGALKLDGIEELAGTVTTAASIHARSSWIEANALERVEAAGHVEVRDVVAAGPGLRHPVSVEEARLELTPRYADLPVFRARMGSSDVRGFGRLDNLLAYVLRGEDLRGTATVSSDYVDLDELKTEEERELEVIRIPPRLDLALAATVDSMTFGDLAMTEAVGDLVVRDQRVTLDRFALNTLGGAVVASGWYDTSDANRPRFDIDFGMSGLDVAGAFAALNTVRALAPVARYATGEFSADLNLSGVLGSDMTPVLGVLNGGGGIRTRGIAIQGMPVLQRLAEVTRIERIAAPALTDLATAVEIRDGRLHVQPFDVGMGPVPATVTGSNGIDGSLDYRLELQVPREILGTEASRFVDGLVEQAGRAGLDLGGAEAIRLDARVGGTMADPDVDVGFGDAIASAGVGIREQARTRLQEEAARRAAEAQEAVDSAAAGAEEALRARADTARAQARERADSIIASAERQADRIRTEADSAAALIRREANARADRLVAEASGPVARRAAEVAGERLR
ncbi:MAG: AsmA-like C-terminal region-containing protein, partial [Gemmatimonadota bacterium]